MKLSTLKQPELLELAGEFGVDADESLNEEQIIARFLDDGVTQDMVNVFYEGKLAALAQAQAEEDAKLEAALAAATPDKPKRGRKVATTHLEVVEVPDQVLIYMDRENPTYKIRGYTFTREHPFTLVEEKDAEFIVEHEEGFSYATPKQAREFYS